MKVSNAISFRVSKIVQKKRFVKDILNSIDIESGRALLVGGAVRDVFLDLPIKDLDFEVYGLTLEQLQKILEKYGVVSLIGKSFGVLRLHGLDVDWSLPRKDSSGRHPIVEYDPYMSYDQAFARRDLTINAMGIDMQTFELIDLFGGLQDLQAKILRSPDLDFFAQDPLRLLRVMQFVGRFNMSVEDELSRLCETIDISKVSRERVEQEFRKLFLQAQQPSAGLLWLNNIGKFDHFLPAIKDRQLLYKKLDLAVAQNYLSDQEKIVIMWAIVLSSVDLPKIEETFEQVSHLEKQPYFDFMRRINNHDLVVRQVVDCVVYIQKLQSKLTDAQMKWLALWIAPELSLRFLLECMSFVQDKSIDRWLEQAENLGVADYPEESILTGKDFLDVATGVQIGLLVKKAYQIQIDQGLIDRSVLKDKVVKFL